MGFLSKPKIKILPPADPEETTEELAKQEKARSGSLTALMEQQGKRGPAQLSAQAPGLKFTSKRRKKTR